MTILISATSCSDNDYVEVEGTWKVLTSKIIGCPDENKSDEVVIEYSNKACAEFGEADCFYKEITFEGGNYFYSNASFENGSTNMSSGFGSYTTDGQNITICEIDKCVEYVLFCEDGVLIMASEKSDSFDGCREHLYLKKM